MSFIIENLDAIISAVEAIIAAAIAIAAVTPTEKDDGILNRISNVFAKLKAVFKK